MYDLLLMFFLSFLNLILVFLFRSCCHTFFGLSTSFFVYLCSAIYATWRLALRLFFCSQFLPQKVMHISVIITYLRFDPSFFRSRSFYASQNHICFHRQLTLLSFIWREMKIVVWNTFSSLCLIFFYFPFYNLFFSVGISWHCFFTFIFRLMQQKPICFIICYALFKGILLLAILRSMSTNCRMQFWCLAIDRFEEAQDLCMIDCWFAGENYFF